MHVWVLWYGVAGEGWLAGVYSDAERAKAAGDAYVKAEKDPPLNWRMLTGGGWLAELNTRSQRAWEVYPITVDAPPAH